MENLLNSVTETIQNSISNAMTYKEYRLCK
jgi:hypothetical protein